MAIYIYADSRPWIEATVERASKQSPDHKKSTPTPSLPPLYEIPGSATVNLHSV